MLSKTRYLLPLPNDLTIELDVFDAPYEGLWLAEVEFPTEDEANAFVPPAWFGEDVTFSSAYHNSTLSSGKKKGLTSAAICSRPYPRNAIRIQSGQITHQTTFHQRLYFAAFSAYSVSTSSSYGAGCSSSPALSRISSRSSKLSCSKIRFSFQVSCS